MEGSHRRESPFVRPVIFAPVRYVLLDRDTKFTVACSSITIGEWAHLSAATEPHHSIEFFTDAMPKARFLLVFGCG